MSFEIYLDDVLINTIYASEAFARAYCLSNGYTYKLREKTSVPTEGNADESVSQLDRIEAQIAYTAMMTDTLLEE